MTRYGESPSDGNVKIQKECTSEPSTTVKKHHRKVARARRNLPDSPPLSANANQAAPPGYCPPPSLYHAQDVHLDPPYVSDDEQDDLEIIVHDEKLDTNDSVSKGASRSSSTNKSKSYSSTVVASPAISYPNLELQHQLEYYFSRQNLASDFYLVSKMDHDLFVPISIIASFRRVQERTTDLQTVVDTLRRSPAVVVDASGTKVKPNISVQRTTVILRDVPGATEKEVTELLRSLDSPPAKKIKFRTGNMCYITFASEQDALKLLDITQGKTFNGMPISLRMESESVLQTILSTRNLQGFDDQHPIQAPVASESNTFHINDSSKTPIPSMIPPYSYYYPYIPIPVQYGNRWSPHYPSPNAQKKVYNSNSSNSSKSNNNSGSTNSSKNNHISTPSKSQHDALFRGRGRSRGKSRHYNRHESHGGKIQNIHGETPPLSNKGESENDSDTTVLEKSNVAVDPAPTHPGTFGDTKQEQESKPTCAADGNINNELYVTTAESTQPRTSLAPEGNKSRKKSNQNRTKRGKNKMDSTGDVRKSTESLQAPPDFHAASFPPLPNKLDSMNTNIGLVVSKDVTPGRWSELPVVALHDQTVNIGKEDSMNHFKKEADPFPSLCESKPVKTSAFSYADKLKNTKTKTNSSH